MKIGLLLVTALFTVFFHAFPGPSFGYEVAQGDVSAVRMASQVDELNLAELEQLIRQLDQEVGGYLPDFSLSAVFRDMREGALKLNFGDIIGGLLRYFVGELLAGSSILGKIVVLAVLCAVLQNLSAAFEKGTASKLAYGVTYLVLFSLALTSFAIAVNIGRQAVQQMVDFVHAILPVMITLMAAVGGIASAALLHPMLLLAVSMLSTLIRNVVFPLVYFAAILAIVSHFSERFQVSRQAKLLRDISIGALGVFMTAFTGVLAIYGIAGAVTDGVTLRAAKFATGAFVPVVGKMLADALEAVVGTSLLLKNAVTVVGIAAIFFITIFPALKILAMAFIYKLAGALVQPFGDGQTADALETMGNSLLLVFAAVVSVGLMFFFVLAIIAGIGNVTVMMR